MSILSFYNGVDHSFTLQAFIDRMHNEELFSGTMHLLKAILNDGKSRTLLPKSGQENYMMILLRYRLIDISVWRLQQVEYMHPGNSKVTRVPADFVSKFLLLSTPSDDIVTTC